MRKRSQSNRSLIQNQCFEWDLKQRGLASTSTGRGGRQGGCRCQGAAGLRAGRRGRALLEGWKCGEWESLLLPSLDAGHEAPGKEEAGRWPQGEAEQSPAAHGWAATWGDLPLIPI